MAPARILIAPVFGTGQVGWRLLASNNRPLGSGTDAFAGLVACAESVLQMQTVALELCGVQSLDLRSGKWVWRAEQRDVCVAVAAREYDAQRDNGASLAAFLRDFATATIGTDDRAIKLPGQRRVLDLPDFETVPATGR